MSGTTTLLGLANGKITGDKIFSTEFNLTDDTLERVYARLADLIGPGFHQAADFNGTLVGGQNYVSVSAGNCFAGSLGALYFITGAVVNSPAGSNGDNYLWVQPDGTLVRTATNVAPVAGAQLALYWHCTAGVGDSVNNLPTGRTNLTELLSAALGGADLPGTASPVTTSGTSPRTVDIQLADVFGRAYGAKGLVEAWLSESAADTISGTAPSAVGTPTNGALVKEWDTKLHWTYCTSATGRLTFTITQGSAHTWDLHVAWKGRIYVTTLVF